jgi:hypothetical protein
MGMCNEPALNARIAELCFGDEQGEDRSALEAHLLVCDECWTEFQRISEAVHVLRSEPTAIEPVMAADLIQLLGLGARLQRPFGGHAWMASVIAVGHGLMMALALLVEVAYQWENYAAWVPYTSFGVALGSIVVSLVSFDSMRRRVLAGRTNSILFGLWPILTWATVIALSIAHCRSCPSCPQIRSSLPAFRR